jgi:hypothetical protein
MTGQPLDPTQTELSEWEEGRKTIDRFDRILADLRKYGFTLITGFITASAFVTYVGVVNKDGIVVPEGGRAAVLSVIFILVASLFVVDNYYQVLLSGSVERALDIEARTNLRVTRIISKNVLITHSTQIILLIYIFLLLTAGLLGLALLPIDTSDLRTVLTLPRVAAVAAFLISAGVILIYYRLSVTGAHITTEKERDWTAS